MTKEQLFRIISLILLDVFLCIALINDIQYAIYVKDGHFLATFADIRSISIIQYISLMIVAVWRYVGEGYCKHIELSRPEKILIILFAIVFVVGYSYEKTDSLILLSNSITQLVFSILLACLIIIFSENSLRIIKYLLLKIGEWNPQILPFWKRHRILFPTIVLFIFWMPYAIIRWPAAIEWDAYHQIMAVMGDYPLNQHWPVASTLFIGYSYKLLLALFHSNDVAIFITVLLQMIVCAILLAWAFRSQIIMKVATGFVYIELILCSILPIIPRYTTSLVKDALFSCCVVAFISQLSIVTIEKENRIPLREIIALIVLGVAVSILRNNVSGK